MKVSIIVYGRFWAFDLARELDRRGFLSQLITTYPRNIARRFGVADEAIVSLPTTEALRRVAGRLPQRLSKAAAKPLLTAFAAHAARHLTPCDVVIGFSGVSAPAFRKAAGWKALRVCERGSSHIHEQERILAEEHRLQGLPWRPWGEKGKSLDLQDYELADVIRIPSQFVKSGFVREGVAEEKLLRVPYGVDLSEFTPGSDIVDIPRVIYAGSMSVRKGVGYLTEGFRRAALPGSQLWLVGGQFRETNQLLGPISDDVTLFGHLPQARLAELYRQCAVFVMPSVEEGLALVQPQALACGLPLICTTNTGGEDLLHMSLPPEASPELVVNGVWRFPAGYVVPIRSPDAIAFALRDVLSDRLRLRSMRSAAIALSNKCDWSRSVGWLIQALNNALYDREVRCGLV